MMVMMVITWFRKMRFPVWHSWHPFQLGASSQHNAPGPGNLLYNNKSDYKNRGPEFSEPNTVYEVSSDWEDDQNAYKLDKVPEYNTLFALKTDTTVTKVPDKKEKYLKTYPNPAKKYFNLVFSGLESSRKFKVSLYNVNGKQIKPDYKKYNSYSGKLKINTKDLIPGIYFIKVKSGNLNFTKKFVKE